MNELQEDIVQALGQLAMVAAKLELLADLYRGSSSPLPGLAYRLVSYIRSDMSRCREELRQVAPR